MSDMPPARLIQNQPGESVTVKKAKTNKPGGWIAAAAVACALLTRLGTPTVAQLPPRPTPQPTAAPEQDDAPTRARIELHARFSADWPGEEKPWQALWTVVQWQDPDLGTWSDVASWQGGLDNVVNDGAASVLGYKTWWVGGSDRGKGPFRWEVYQERDGLLLATSESFNLPHKRRGVTVVGVNLSP